jgi:PAS domain S-box-containing protein
VEQALRELSENLEQRVMARTQALRDSEERFRALVEASAQIVWTTDAAGAIVEDSPSWRAYTGQSYEAWRGWGWLEMIHPDDRIDVAQLWRKAVAATTPINTDYRLYHHSGQWRWSNVRAVPLRSLSGTVRGWVGMIIDIDAHKQAEVALHRLNEALEARTKEIHTLASRLTMAEQEERRRISQILHDDLQQHLYGIQMKIDYARYGAEAGDQAQMMKNIAEAEAWLVQATNITRHLTVDLSPPVLKNEGLTDTLSWLVTQMQSLYDLTVVVTATQSFRMASEDMRVLLFQIIRELLFNVVKHAETNRATVKLQLVEKQLMIEVADEGIGFDVSRAAAQVDDHSRFGLFSARERLRLFGGQLEIDSAPGQGTRINIAVPVDLI